MLHGSKVAGRQTLLRVGGAASQEPKKQEEEKEQRRAGVSRSRSRSAGNRKQKHWQRQQISVACIHIDELDMLHRPKLDPSPLDCEVWVWHHASCFFMAGPLAPCFLVA